MRRRSERVGVHERVVATLSNIDERADLGDDGAASCHPLRDAVALAAGGSWFIAQNRPYYPPEPRKCSESSQTLGFLTEGSGRSGSETCHREAAGAGQEFVVDMATQHPQPLPRDRSDIMARDRPQPDRVP